MGLTIVKEPKTFTGVKNPVYYELTSDKYQITTGGLAGVTLLFVNGLLTDGDTLQFDFNGYSVLYTFQAGSVLDDEIDYTAWGADADTLADLMRHRDINRNYDGSITAGSTYTFEAFENGTLWDLTMTITVFNASAITISASSTGSDDVFQEGMKMIADVSFGDTQIATLESQVDAQSVGRFNLEELLASQLGPGLMDYADTDPRGHSQMLKQFTVRFHELYQNQYLGRLKYIVNVFNGGEPFDQWTMARDYFDYFVDNARLCFNGAPDFYLVGADQQHALYWYVESPSTTKINLVVTFQDGTTESKVLAKLTNANLINSYPVGLAQVGTTLTGDIDDVVSYTVQVEQSDGDSSPVKRFLVSREAKKEQHYFQFQNDLGGFDPALLIGVKRELRTADRVVGQIHRPLAYYETAPDPVPSEVFVRNRSGQRAYKIHAVLDGLEDKAYLTQMLRSDYIYWQTGGKYVPIVISKNDFKDHSDFDSEYVLELEFVAAFND